MKIQTEFTEDHQAKLTVEFEPEVLEQYKHRAARKIAQQTRIPGFRPGKAPYNMVMNYVGEASILDEAIGMMVDKFYPDILTEAGIEPYASGSLDAIKSENPPVFLFTVPLEPEVELGGLDDLKVPFEPPTISEDEVQNTIIAAQRNAGTIVPLDTPAKEGDLVYFTLSGLNANPQEGEEPELVKSSPQQLIIPTEAEQHPSEWPFEGFGRQLIGVQAGDERKIEHEFPEDSNDKTFAGKHVIFTVKVQSVKGLQPHEIDDDFLKSMGDFTSREEMEQYIRTTLQANAVAEYEENYYRDLIDRIRKESVLKYPPQMVTDEVDQVMADFEHELSHQQMDLDLYLKLRKLEKEDFIKEEVRPTAINRLERSLVMDAISKKFDIHISNDELEKQISAIITDLMQTGELEEVQRSLGEKKFAEAVSMRAAQQALDEALHLQLRRIAAPESLPAEEPEQVQESQVTDEETPEVQPTSESVMPEEETEA